MGIMDKRRTISAQNAIMLALLALVQLLFNVTAVNKTLIPPLNTIFHIEQHNASINVSMGNIKTLLNIDAGFVIQIVKPVIFLEEIAPPVFLIMASTYSWKIISVCKSVLINSTKILIPLSVRPAILAVQLVLGL